MEALSSLILQYNKIIGKQSKLFTRLQVTVKVQGSL